MFYPFSIKVNKCSGRCNDINDPYTRSCIPDVIKNINVKIFNLVSWINQTKHVEWHETCKCKCRLDASVCNNKQRWNEDKCECRELIDNGMCDKRFIWNPSNCNCEYDKSCDIGEYLDYKNCKCRRKKICSENIGENEMIYNETLHISLGDYKCNSCTLYIVLFVVILVISVIIGSVLFTFIGIQKRTFCSEIFYFFSK